MPYEKPYKQDVLSAYYDIYVGGNRLNLEKKICIENVEIKETEDGADTARFSIIDTNFEFIEDDIFIEDVPIHIVGGWHNEMYRYEFNGYIATIDIDFPNTGTPSLEIFCVDKTHLMNRKKKKRTWKNVSSADIVKLICKEYGFSVELEKGYKFKKEETITQSNQTDIEFIQSLAQKESDVFISKLRESTLHYIKKGLLTTPVIELWYKQDTREIISFSPKINRETKQEKVERATITSKDKKLDKGAGSLTETNIEPQGKPSKTTSSPTYNFVDGEWLPPKPLGPETGRDKNISWGAK